MPTNDVEIDPITGCWLHVGTKSHDGYAVQGGKYLHRVDWERAHRTRLPPGVELDHRCRRRHCRRPSHLDPVTRAENDRRRSKWQRLTLDRCPDGHPLKGDNAIPTPEGGVVCAICNRGEE